MTSTMMPLGRTFRFVRAANEPLVALGGALVAAVVVLDYLTSGFDTAGAETTVFAAAGSTGTNQPTVA